MSSGRILGIVLLIGGVGLIIAGFIESRSFADSVSSFFGAGLTRHTMSYFIGGIAAALAGFFLLNGAFSRR